MPGMKSNESKISDYIKNAESLADLQSVLEGKHLKERHFQGIINRAREKLTPQDLFILCSELYQLPRTFVEQNNRLGSPSRTPSRTVKPVYTIGLGAELRNEVAGILLSSESEKVSAELLEIILQNKKEELNVDNVGKLVKHSENTVKTLTAVADLNLTEEQCLSIAQRELDEDEGASLEQLYEKIATQCVNSVELDDALLSKVEELNENTLSLLAGRVSADKLLTLLSCENVKDRVFRKVLDRNDIAEQKAAVLELIAEKAENEDVFLSVVSHPNATSDVCRKAFANQNVTDVVLAAIAQRIIVDFNSRLARKEDVEKEDVESWLRQLLAIVQHRKAGASVYEASLNFIKEESTHENEAINEAILNALGTIAQRSVDQNHLATIADLVDRYPNDIKNEIHLCILSRKGIAEEALLKTISERTNNQQTLLLIVQHDNATDDTYASVLSHTEATEEAVNYIAGKSTDTDNLSKAAWHDNASDETHRQVLTHDEASVQTLFGIVYCNNADNLEAVTRHVKCTKDEHELHALIIEQSQVKPETLAHLATYCNPGNLHKIALKYPGNTDIVNSILARDNLSQETFEFLIALNNEQILQKAVEVAKERKEFSEELYTTVIAQSNANEDTLCSIAEHCGIDNLKALASLANTKPYSEKLESLILNRSNDLEALPPGLIDIFVQKSMNIATIQRILDEKLKYDFKLKKGMEQRLKTLKMEQTYAKQLAEDELEEDVLVEIAANTKNDANLKSVINYEFDAADDDAEICFDNIDSAALENETATLGVGELVKIARRTKSIEVLKSVINYSRCQDAAIDRAVLANTELELERDELCIIAERADNETAKDLINYQAPFHDVDVVLLDKATAGLISLEEPELLKIADRTTSSEVAAKVAKGFKMGDVDRNERYAKLLNLKILNAEALTTIANCANSENLKKVINYENYQSHAVDAVALGNQYDPKIILEVDELLTIVNREIEGVRSPENVTAVVSYIKNRSCLKSLIENEAFIAVADEDVARVDAAVLDLPNDKVALEEKTLVTIAERSDVENLRRVFNYPGNSLERDKAILERLTTLGGTIEGEIVALVNAIADRADSENLKLAAGLTYAPDAHPEVDALALADVNLVLDEPTLIKIAGRANGANLAEVLNYARTAHSHAIDAAVLDSPAALAEAGLITIAGRANDANLAEVVNYARTPHSHAIDAEVLANDKVALEQVELLAIVARANAENLKAVIKYPRRQSNQIDAAVFARATVLGIALGEEELTIIANRTGAANEATWCEIARHTTDSARLTAFTTQNIVAIDDVVAGNNHTLTGDLATIARRTAAPATLTAIAAQNKGDDVDDAVVDNDQTDHDTLNVILQRTNNLGLLQKIKDHDNGGFLVGPVDAKLGELEEQHRILREAQAQAAAKAKAAAEAKAAADAQAAARPSNAQEATNVAVAYNW